MEYPEHDKLKAIQDRSQACGEFLDWLQEQRIHLMRYEMVEDTKPCSCRGVLGSRRADPACPKCGGSGEVVFGVPQWVPERRNPLKLLADFFGIDQDKLEAEKRAMLEELRKAP